MCYGRRVATSKRSPDPQRIAVAKIDGTLQRCVVASSITEDESLVAIGAALGPVAELSWPTVLADAAASYVDATEPWKQNALQLLVRAGVDLEEARRARDGRPGGGYSGFTH
jgi:hypothetical protein